MSEGTCVPGASTSTDCGAAGLGAHVRQTGGLVLGVVWGSRSGCGWSTVVYRPRGGAMQGQPPRRRETEAQVVCGSHIQDRTVLRGAGEGARAQVGLRGQVKIVGSGKGELGMRWLTLTLTLIQTPARTLTLS